MASVNRFDDLDTQLNDLDNLLENPEGTPEEFIASVQNYTAIAAQIASELTPEDFEETYTEEGEETEDEQ